MSLPSPFMERLIAGITLCIAFLVMASIIVPDPTAAHDEGFESTTDGQPPLDVPTTDPHEGLVSLGSLESRGYFVEFYATSVGPRYTVCDGEGAELGILLSAEQVAEHFPELPLPQVDFSATSTIMLAEPEPQPW